MGGAEGIGAQTLKMQKKLKKVVESCVYIIVISKFSLGPQPKKKLKSAIKHAALFLVWYGKKKG